MKQNFKVYKTQEPVEPKDYLYIVQYGGGPDESYLKGSPEGLKRFGEELIRVSEKKENYDPHVYDLFDESEVGIDYVEVIEGGVSINIPKPSMFGKITSITIGLLLLSSLLVGFVTIFGFGIHIIKKAF